MPTAIMMVYTKDGFVVASDGQGNRPNGIKTTRERKIAPIVGPHWVFVLGFYGTASLVDANGNDAFQTIYDNTTALLAKRDFKELTEYARLFSQVVAPRLNPDVRLRSPFLLPDSDVIESKLYLHLHFAGYFKNKPMMCSYRIDFFNDRPTVRVLKDCGIAHVRQYIVEGSSKVMARVMCDNSGFFKTRRNVGLEKLWRHGNNNLSLKEAGDAVRSYIQVCKTSEAKIEDPENCNFIGGDTYVATITPENGFKGEWETDPASSS